MFSRINMFRFLGIWDNTGYGLVYRADLIKVKPDGSSLQQSGVQNVSRLFSPQTGGKYVNFILIILNNNTWLLVTASDRARTALSFSLGNSVFTVTGMS